MNRRFWMIAMHIVWWIVLLMALSVFVMSRWEGYTLLQTTCQQLLHCESPMRLTEDAAHDLERYGLSASYYSGLIVVFTSIANISYLAVGALLYRYKRNDMFGLCASLFLIITGTIFTADAHILHGAPLIQTFFYILDGIGSFYLPFLFLFPDGKFAPKWTVIPAFIWIAAQSFRFFYPEVWLDLNWNPLFMTMLLLVTHGPLLYSLRHRYRSAQTVRERRHVKWFLISVLSYMLGGSLFALQYIMQDGLLQLIFQVAFFAGLLFWPFSIGIGVLERKSETISASLHQALLFSTLSFLIVWLYAATVGGFSMLMRNGDMLVSLVASGIVAALFHPIYIRLQRGINRLVYGEPVTPYQMMNRLVDRMDQVVRRESVWTEVVEGIAQALNLPYAALKIRNGTMDELVAEYGRPIESMMRVPLQWNGELIGALELGASKLSEAMSTETGELLQHLVRQVSGAMHTARITEELQQSRERLVTAREEERRRLGRDLHDGLGAGLASVLLQTDAIVDHDEGDTKLNQQLHGIQKGIEQAIADIRHLVYALRPPVLNEFGLLFAIQELAVRYEGPGLAIVVEAPERLPKLSAAAEVAVYRIVQEALTNAIRHGEANQCHICFMPSNGLELIVKDNGKGLQEPFLPGIGIRSMRERAEELGGRCELSSFNGEGTEVRIFIPNNRGIEADGRS
jgi:signal transduction histidine kinase